MKSKGFDKKIIIGIILIVLVVGFFAFSGNSSATVSAQGYSEIKASPDKVSVYSGIEGRGTSAQEAKVKHDEINSKIIAMLEAEGFSEDEIKQTYFSVYPEYDWSNGQQKLKGYLASSQIVIETGDFDLVAKAVDAAISGGASVNSINFELSSESQSEYKAQALEQASADAKKKAEATAAGLGKKLGTLVSVQSSDFNYPGPIPYYARTEGGVASDASIVAEVKQAALNLAPQDITVSASVQVSYKVR